MSLVPEQAAFLRDFAKLIEFAFSRGYTVTGGELERKPEMQQIYVKTGRSKTMDSMHLRRCAVDLNFFRESNGTFEAAADFDSLREIGQFWESLDARNRWGGNWNSFKDLPHFERNLTTSATARAAPPPVLVSPPPPPVLATAVAVPAPAQSAGPDGASFARTIGPGSSDQRAIALLQTLLAEIQYLADIDGSYGPGTERAVRKFQGDKGLKVDGSVGEKTWTALIAAAPQVFQTISSRWIGEADFDNAAARLQCEGASVRAVYEVESGGCGFLGLKPKILFEGATFWDRLKAAGLDPQRLRAGNEDIIQEKWTKQFYKGGLAEYGRLDRAIALHRAAALESASWGLFQVMGFHWQKLGYADVEDFVAKMQQHEREHLLAFAAFLETKEIQGKTLAQWLREKNWSTFALGYNGSGYRENRYDDRLAAAYHKNAG